jgi:hypothetical protein
MVDREDKVVVEGMTCWQMGPVYHIQVGVVKLGLLLKLLSRAYPNEHHQMTSEEDSRRTATQP